MNSDEKNIKCECGGLTFAVTYNHKEAKINLYCTSCDKIAHSRNVLWNPLENIQGDIIDLLRLVFDRNIKAMTEFVIDNLETNKVSNCTDMKKLEKAFYILYNASEFSNNPANELT